MVVSLGLPAEQAVFQEGGTTRPLALQKGLGAGFFSLEAGGLRLDEGDEGRPANQTGATRGMLVAFDHPALDGRFETIGLGRQNQRVDCRAGHSTHWAAEGRLGEPQILRLHDRMR